MNIDLLIKLATDLAPVVGNVVQAIQHAREAANETDKAKLDSALAQLREQNDALFNQVMR